MNEVSSWFVVLPDESAAEEVAGRLRAYSTQEISHPSERPWILGRWREDAATVGGAGRTKVAVIGQHAVRSGDLADAARGITTIADAESLASSMLGSSHLMVSVPGAVRVQGTVVGVRRVYRSQLAGMTVAADRADVLARLTRAALDEERFALRLLDSPALYPLAGGPVWQGVELVPTHHYLVMTDAASYTVRRWTPPDPVLPMIDAAAALRDALSTAVDMRVDGRDLVSADLGGLDSTAICSLAAHSTADVVAYTAAIFDPRGDDVSWARRTVAGLGRVEHYVIEAEEMPMAYEGVLDHHEPLDEPCTSAIDISRSLTVSRRAAERGSRMHLVGIGGDELLYGSVAHLHSLIRTKPLIAIGHLRGFATKYRWRRTATLRQLLDRRPYREWLSVVGSELSAPPEPLDTPLLDWGFRPRLPPWASPAAVDAVRDLIEAEARVAEPLSPIRGQHRELEGMRSLTCLVRQYEQLAAGFGITFAAPYYDDHVIEAGLSARPEERITPWRYKPLIIEAMRGVVPDESLRRQTKATASFEEEVGVRQHREELVSLWEDSRLGALGMIDVDKLRAVCNLPVPSQLQMGALHQTVACELWLRELECSAPQTPHAPHTPPPAEGTRC